MNRRADLPKPILLLFAIMRERLKRGKVSHFSESTFFLVTVARSVSCNFPFQKNISFRRGGNIPQDLLPNVQDFRALTYAAVASLQPHKFASPPSCHYYCILSSNRGSFTPNSVKIGYMVQKLKLGDTHRHTGSVWRSQKPVGFSSYEKERGTHTT